MLKVAINGFGRIGRSAFRIAVDRFKDQLDVVAINDLTDNKTLAHLLKYDTAYGKWQNHDVSADDKHLVVDSKKIIGLAEKEPAKLPWKNLGIDVVIESTGRFVDGKQAAAHIQAGAKRVIISAPSKGDEPAPTFMLGVNEYDGSAQVVNNGSCTTNATAAMLAVLHNAFGVEKAMMTTVHAYTQDQNLQDGPHKDLRRARAAAQNIVPTSSGASVATGEAIPDLKGKFSAVAIRVPVVVGSIADLTAVLKKEATVEQVNQAFKDAAKNPIYKGVVEVTEEPIVSSDIVGTTASAIVDLSLTEAIGNLVKVFGWYDNEWGYSNRLVEQVVEVGKKLH